MTDNIHLKDAREALMRGIMKARDVIAGTLGPTGHSVIIQSLLYPGQMIVDDGYLALKAIKLSEPLEQMGIELLKEAVDKSNKESGDGSTTSLILTASILEEGLKTGLSGREIKESLDECLPIIEASLKDQTKTITEVGPVATIASGDEKIGAMLQEIYNKVGKDGIVELDLSKTPETFYEIIEGVRLHNCGYLHPYMTTDGKKAVLDNPLILIAKQKIITHQDIDPLFMLLSEQGTRELVIFCEDIDPAVLQTFAIAHQQGLFKTFIIKAPTLFKDWLFEDFAKITGATIVDVEQGHSFKRLKELIKQTGKMPWLGTCKQIIIHKDETIVIGTYDISAHIMALQDAGKTDDQQLLRASWLQTKTAILKVGANSESELSLKRAKIEDARNAAYQALQGGVVPGGGIALCNAAKLLPKTTGGEILEKALQAPTIQLLDNMNQESFDSEGIVDPTNVVKNAIRNAISVAGTILTSNAVITLPEKV